ncbi:tectonic-like complex member MKS1 [Diorhabda sublineata]|uniref:tectonic-like complex member MKS1 n=1 Tax=Diorhabda sublineata TaxID=1163346 RepID=UPI0024E15631|nr:tectonic-like complex member MKS1 [Diorhabda sublineata]
MYNFKDRITKYTGNYKTPDDINNLKIRIRLKQEIFEDTADKNVDWYVKEFLWQEKYFSKCEQEFYQDLRNCDSDLSRIYNEKIVTGETNDDSIFFTRTNEDEFDGDKGKRDKTDLETLLEKVDLNKEHKSICNHNFEDSVINSIENKIIPNIVEKMYILADLGEYIDDIWIKNEFILCTLKYEKVSKTFSIYPDFTTTKPYILRIQGECLKYVHYFIENASASIQTVEEFNEMNIITKVAEKKNFLIKELTGDKFFVPPKNKLFVYLFIDILSAQGFEYNNLYLQYFVDLPEYWTCDDLVNLEGVTQTGHWTNGEGLVHFGHNFDLVLEYDIQSLSEMKTPKSPCIYFQIISKGSFDRYRTEGLAYQNIPVSRPGCYLYNLSCYRFDPVGYSEKLRRFFIGDAYNYKDPRWIGVPKEKDCENGVFNKFGTYTIGTGQLQVRLNVLHQSQAFLKEFKERDVKEKFIYEKLNSSSLIKSVNQVLVAFKKARRKMYEVKKEL